MYYTHTCIHLNHIAQVPASLRCQQLSVRVLNPDAKRTLSGLEVRIKLACYQHHHHCRRRRDYHHLHIVTTGSVIITIDIHSCTLAYRSWQIKVDGEIWLREDLSYPVQDVEVSLSRSITSPSHSISHIWSSFSG